MREYSTVSPKVWTGSTGKALRGDTEAQLLAMYLITSPHSTMTGVFYCPLIYMAHDTGLPLEGASKALQRLIEGGFVEYDEASETVFVVNMARWQISEKLKPTDNRVKNIRDEVRKMPEGRIRARFLELYKDRFCLADEPKKESPSEGPPDPLRSQEQEQEQEQEQAEGESADPPGAEHPVAAKPEKWTEEDRQLAQSMLDEIRKISPSIKGSKRWPDDVRLMRERDHRSLAEIWDLFTWANQDSFWGANILSPGKLREKWPQLEAQRNRPQRKLHAVGPGGLKPAVDNSDVARSWAAKHGGAA